MKQSRQTVPDRHPAVRRLAFRTTAWFTVLVLLALAPALFSGGSENLMVSTSGVYLLFPLAVCLAAAGAVRRSGVKPSVKWPLHAVLCVGGAYLFGYLPYQIRNRSGAAQVLLMLLLILLVYAAALIVLLLIGRRRTHNAASVPQGTSKN